MKALALFIIGACIFVSADIAHADTIIPVQGDCQPDSVQPMSFDDVVVSFMVIADSSAHFVHTRTVKPGDNLSAIARDLQNTFGTLVSWQELYRSNAETIGANPNLIYPGMQLKFCPAFPQVTFVGPK